LLHILIAVGVLAAAFILLGFIRMWIVEWRFGSILDTQIPWNIGFNISPDQNTNAVHNMLNGAPLIGSSPYYMQNQSWDLGRSGSSFILTSIIAVYGWLAGIGVLLIFTSLLALMFIRSRRIPHTFGKMLTIGIIVWLFIRFTIVLLTNTGVIGTISDVLPFVSFSNSDYIYNSLLIGVFLSVWRRSSFMKDGHTLQPVMHN
jgi:cell division protein FtsW (lipid II flippase)